MNLAHELSASLAFLLYLNDLQQAHEVEVEVRDGRRVVTYTGTDRHRLAKLYALSCYAEVDRIGYRQFRF